MDARVSAIPNPQMLRRPQGPRGHHPSTHSFCDKTVLISGGSSGIGRALAEALSRQGARVAIVGTSADKLRETSKAIRCRGGRVETARFDVADEEAWKSAVPALEGKLGPIDSVFLNAGVGTDRMAIEDVTDSVWRWIWEVNVMGTVYGLRACLPGMKRRRRPGHVLITSSIAALAPKLGLAPYAVTKAGLVGLAESLRAELTGTAIGVSVLIPAAVRTEFYETCARHAPADFRNEQAVQAFTDIGGVLRNGIAPTDVAKFALERIAEGAFYIFTHPDFRDGITARQNEMMSAIPPDTALQLDTPGQTQPCTRVNGSAMAARSR